MGRCKAKRIEIRYENRRTISVTTDLNMYTEGVCVLFREKQRRGVAIGAAVKVLGECAV